MKNTKTVGIVGGTGYTAGELMRILLGHSQFQLRSVTSRNAAGQRVSDVHTDLVQLSHLHFSTDLSADLDLVFLCLPHGQSRLWLEQNRLPASAKVVDLSRDYRLGNSEYVYGLPEVHRNRIVEVERVANPGCFATAIQLALLPLAAAAELQQEIHISAITGSTGAGQTPLPTTHFSWRHGNVSVYKAFRHQHLEEIGQTLTFLQPGFDKPLTFIPFRGGFTRGILAAVYLESGLGQEAAAGMYADYYRDHPFVFITDKNPDLKQVVNTNNCILYLQKEAGKLMIISIIDNLVKGAAGQAVQNANLMFGLDEMDGLQLKASAF